MNYDVSSDATFAAVLVFALFAAVLAVVADNARFFRRAVRWIQKDPVVRTALVILLFCIGPITARTKNGQLSLSRPPLLLQVEEPAPEPAIAPVSVWTNGVAFRAESTNVVEITAFRTVGGTELGDWIETAEPFFAIGTNPVSRCYVSASGSISFNSMRRPPVGSALPDLWVPPPERGVAQSAGGSTSYSVLCPLRAPLGMVPEARWPMIFGQDGQDCQDEQDSPASGDGSVPVNPDNPANPVKGSRFWHDALPGGGRVLTWENALVDRLPGRRVSLQVELLPTGDCVYRYDFHDALDPPATNFVIGAQIGTNGVNALAMLGTLAEGAPGGAFTDSGPLAEGAPGGAGWGCLAATVWTMDGAPVTNGVSIADLLCANGVLRTPATFEIRWKNTTGLDPDADTDGDGLTDWAEIFQLWTNPNHADTDGDSISDNVERMMGTDPLDADEDGDGVPDGTSAAAWFDNALWASNASEAAYSIAITLNSAVPAGTSASLIVGSLCIPLRSPGSWTLGLVPGELYPYRLNVGGNVPVSLSIGPGGDAPPMRGSMNAMSIALWVDGMGGTFDGRSLGGSGNMAIPTLNVTWDDPDDGSHEGISGVCLHGGSEAVFTPALQPGIVHGEWMLNNLDERNGQLVLSVPYEGVVYHGSAILLSDNIRFGFLQTAVSAHQCDSSYGDPYCSICGHYQPDDFSLSVCSPLTLKHDDETSICLSHPNSPGTTIQNRTIQIRRKTNPETAWLTLGTESALNSWTAKIAGTFELRGRGMVDGIEVFTPITEIEVKFPSFDQITNDASVISMANAAWTATLADCSSTNKRERGFWIYLNTLTDTYEAGSLCLGEWTGVYGSGSVSLPARPPDETEPIAATAAGARYPVASFHTHTSTVFWRIGERMVGPTAADNRLDYNDRVPGLVFDYVEDSPGSQVIKWGHPLNAPAMIYKSLGVERRPTP